LPQVARRPRRRPLALALPAAILVAFLQGAIPAPRYAYAVFGATTAPVARVGKTACAGKKKGGGGGGSQKGAGGGGGKSGGGGGGDSGAVAEDIDTGALMKDYEDKMGKTLEALTENFVGIRAGRAAPAMLNEIKVSAYGSDVGINEVATVSVTDTRTLTVSCFDDSLTPKVEKAIITSNMGYTVNLEGSSIRVMIPELTKDKRTQYAKLAKDFTEKSRVAVRNVRQAAMKKIKGLSKKISEDIAKGMEKEVEALVKKNNKALDDMLKKKETELLQA